MVALFVKVSPCANFNHLQKSPLPVHLCCKHFLTIHQNKKDAEWIKMARFPKEYFCKCQMDFCLFGVIWHFQKNTLHWRTHRRTLQLNRPGRPFQWKYAKISKRILRCAFFSIFQKLIIELTITKKKYYINLFCGWNMSSYEWI